MEFKSCVLFSNSRKSEKINIYLQEEARIFNNQPVFGVR